jgi:abequosyltransferase
MVLNNLSLPPPLLTVAIPTWNRAQYLARNLAQLQTETATIPIGMVEILVSDNCSPDETPEVVSAAASKGLPTRYIRNETNLGWALNFAQCFDLARGKYVLLLGDDDLFVDGALRYLVERLAERSYGVVCMKSYGFDVDFRREYPGGRGRDRYYDDANDFLVSIGPWMTLISACVINKSLLLNIDSRQFASGDLGAVHFVLRAALAADHNLYIDRYLIAGKRQNSFAYEFAEVFVRQFWSIIDAYTSSGLSSVTIRTLERKMMLSYYPFYLFDLRLARRGDLKTTDAYFSARFGRSLLFRYWLAPTIRWPRPLALLWGAATTFLGRVLGGELRRGVMFAWSRVARGVGGLRRV